MYTEAKTYITTPRVLNRLSGYKSCLGLLCLLSITACLIAYQNMKSDGSFVTLPWMDDATRLEQEFIHRLETVAKVCQRYGAEASYGDASSLHLPIRSFRYCEKAGLTVCFVAKAGTSSWSRLLVHDCISQEELSAFVDPSKRDMHPAAAKLLVVSENMNSDQTAKYANGTDLVMTVRHPFDRVVSAYANKISLCGRYCDVEKEAPFFRMFVSIVVSDINKVLASSLRGSEDPIEINAHWRPYYMNCGPCDFRYRYIVKLENYGNEVSYILNKHGVNFESITKVNSASSSGYALKLLKTLPAAELEALYTAYKIDFEMFEYSKY